MDRTTKFHVRIADAPVKPSSVSVKAIRAAVTKIRDVRSGAFTSAFAKKAGEKIRIPGLGTFVVAKRAARMGKSRQTGKLGGFKKK